MQYTEECKVCTHKLIEKLCDFAELQNLGTTGKTTEEYIAISKMFEPLNDLYIPNPPDNLYKLYDI